MSTKLSNSIEYANLHFPKEFGEYLLFNGFKCWTTKGNLNFYKEEVCRLFVRGDNIDVFLFVAEKVTPECNGWLFSQSHAGISLLNFPGWTILLHLMGVVNLQGVSMDLSVTAIENLFKSSLPIVKA